MTLQLEDRRPDQREVDEGIEILSRPEAVRASSAAFLARQRAGKRVIWAEKPYN